MYKTIRHGENSLQYTILPQNDDIRMDGKLTTACSNSINNCNRIKRGKKKTFFAYLGLLFICTIIIGAILIPFLVSAECLPNPTDWFMKTKITLSGHSNYTNNNSNKTAQKLNQTKATTTTTTATATTSSPSSSLINNNLNNLNQTSGDAINVDISITTTTIQNDLYNNNLELNNNQNDNQDDFININKPNKKSNDDLLLSTNHDTLMVNQQNDKTLQLNRDNVIAKMKFDEMIIPSTQIPFELLQVTTVKESITTTTTTTAIPANNPQTIIMKYGNMRRLLPPLPPKPVTRRPLNLPILAKTNLYMKENDKFDGQHDKEPQTWMRSHWPFIDSSTYFHWTGYTVLLPAILGIILIGIILILTVCLVSRNKGVIVASVRKRNRNDIDDTGEDNTTLLTTSNLSDDADDE